MRLLPVLLICAISAAPATSLANPDGPSTPKAEDLGQIFCLSRTGNDEALIAGILSDSLRAAIADAEARSDAWAKAHPDEKPPLGDGIPWQSAPDYAATCKPGLVTLMKTDARVDLAYGFPEAPAADFVDTLILKRTSPADGSPSLWRIDNVFYPDGTDLRSALVAAFAGYD